MSDDKTQLLLQGGIKAARSGQKDLARKAFTQVLKLEPHNEAAWLGMATISEDAKDKLKILKHILEINPNNEQAKEALRRLGVESERLAGSAIQTAAQEEPIPEPPLSAMDEDEIPLPPLPGDDAIPMPPLPGDDDIPLPPLPVATDKPVTGSLPSLRRLETGEITAVPEPTVEELPEIKVELKSSDEVFPQLPPPPAQGQNGLPVPPREVVEHVSQQALANVQAYLEEILQQYENVTWEKKTRGRAGESEYIVFLLQVSAAVFVFLLIVGGATTVAILRSATAQRFLFGPSDTPTFTPTFTPTNTPGPTNTPSPTPSVQPTASPELDASVTPGNADQYFPPEPTRIYFVAAENFGVATAVALFDRGESEAGFEALQTERAAVASFEFTPTYYLVIYYLQQGDVDTAQQLVDDWVAENMAEGEEELSAQPYLPYVDAAYARIELFQAQQSITEGGSAADLLASAEERLTDILNEDEDGTGDINFLDAYLLMAERFRLAGQYDEALDVLEDAIQNHGFYGNTEVRLAREKIFREQQRYADALQELYNILVLNPFLEPALIEQIEVAMESNQPGLAVLYSQQYLLYYPGSVRGFYLLGQAREAENKNDLAIYAYSRALLGPEDNPYYVLALQARTRLYLEQGDDELAQADLTTALELSDNDPNVRLQRMNAAFVAGDTETALDDAEALLESGEVNDAPILLLQGRILVETEDYREGLNALQQAVQRGLPPEDRSLANEYLARANLGVNSLNSALDAINAALEDAETGTRRYIRGQINQERGDLESAIADYEFVLTWGKVYPYPFLDEAQARYDEVLERLGQR